MRPKTPRATRAAWPLLLLLPLAACIENEERVTVHPDLSLDVVLAASGDTPDLLSGYPLPIDGPWRAVDSRTQTWLDAMAGRRPGGDLDLADDEELAVAATFASAAELPRWTAPRSHPYRTAFLERGTEVTVEPRGGKRVYVFERVFRARPAVGNGPWEQAKRELPEELREKADDVETLTVEEWGEVVDVLRPVLADTATRLAREALLGIYTEGEATLSAAGHARIVDAAHRTALEVYSVAAFERLVELLHADEHEELGRFGRDLEARGREALRDALEQGLAAEGVAVPVANAVLARLEWSFTALDHDEDLEDESFTLRVAMPGAIVGGNFDLVEDGEAVWRFHANELLERDVRLRVVSVLE